MNFTTEKMAKALSFPNRTYFAELKKFKPALFMNLYNLYNDNFKIFFDSIASKIKKLLHSQLDIKKFIEEIKKELKSREELEKELQAKRVQAPIDVDADQSFKILESKNNDPYYWSDDESILQSGTINIWKQKYEALETDFNILNQRYSSCKNALSNQIIANKNLEKEICDLESKCVCGKIEQLFKRARVE